MSQVSAKLRRMSDAYAHWCPGCQDIHRLPDSWQFNGNVDRPSFTPSFKHSGYQVVKDANGKWTGEWVRDDRGNPVPEVCHYTLTDAMLNFCADSTHALAGKSVPLPDLPTHAVDY